MATEQQLKNLKPFGPDNPPPGTGRPKGSPNRKTLLRKWLDVTSDNGTVEDDVAIALIKQAQKGDVAAIKEIFDSVHGKVVDKSETTFKEVSSSADDVAKRYVERLKGK